MQNLAAIDLFYAGEDWAKLRRPGALEAARQRLVCVAEWLDDKAFLEGGSFTAGDLMMATVLRILRHTDLVTADAVFGPYLARCEARPAFQRPRRAIGGVRAQRGGVTRCVANSVAPPQA